MKTQISLCIVFLVIALAFKSAEAIPNNCLTARNAHSNGSRAIVNSHAYLKKTHVVNVSALDSVTRLLRLKLIIDAYNYDDIVIAFNSGTTTAYDPNEDSQYMAGINAPEGLSSYSSDGVPLAINFLPLPKKAPLIVKLNTEAANSGAFRLERTVLDSLPPIYEVWLMDSYKKDSLDLRKNSEYAFTINKADSLSFGKNRFYVVIRQNAALGVHLLGFTAIKDSTGAQINWQTENEQNYTKFAVERSTDNGTTYNILKSIKSDAMGNYSFLDVAPPVSADLYRLRIEDLNGTISFSGPVTLMYANVNSIASNVINVYPNPVTGFVTFAVNQSTSFSGSTVPQTLNVTPASLYSIKIISNTGEVIKTETSTQANVPSDVSKLRPGIYVIQIWNNNNKNLVGQGKFIKL